MHIGVAFTNQKMNNKRKVIVILFLLKSNVWPYFKTIKIYIFVHQLPKAIVITAAIFNLREKYKVNFFLDPYARVFEYFFFRDLVDLILSNVISLHF